MKRIGYLFFVFFSFYFLSLPVLSWTQSVHTKLQLITETKTLQPGQSLWVGVLLKHDRNWHSYYKNPGESGLPTKINWQLPAGFKIGEIQWPAPTRIEVSGIVNYGYENQVLLLSRLIVPPSLTPGQKVTLSAQVNFLVCKEECIPAKATLTDSLYIEETLPQNQHQKLIAQTLEQIALEQQGVIYEKSKNENLLFILLAAFLGGMILNLMPCVFPVIAIKVFGFLQHAKDGPHAARVHAFVYTLGILFSFWLLAGVLMLLKTFGLQLGWGFQLQSPVIVLGLAVLFLVLSANLWGLFEINFAFRQSSRTFQNPYAATFLQGVLAVVVATPCTAPFMGAALGYALTVPLLISFLVFTFLGLGLAAPYLFLSFYPPLIKKLPKPGNWMLILKKVLALPLFLTAAWLLFLFWGLVAPQVVTQTVSAQGVWEVYTPQREQQLLKAHQPFFIDFTAKWCLTCQVNKKLVLEKAEVLKKFKQKNYTLIRADWTKQDGVISQSLTRYGRSGVPVYVLYDGKNKPKLLPEILTVSMLLNEIK